MFQWVNKYSKGGECPQMKSVRVPTVIWNTISTHVRPQIVHGHIQERIHSELRSYRKGFTKMHVIVLATGKNSNTTV